MTVDASLHLQQKMFGVFELDAAGTVLYCKMAINGNGNAVLSSAVGHNFFDEIAPFENAREFRQRLDVFVKGSTSVDTFTFLGLVKDDVVRAKVMLVRVSEQGNNNRTKSVIVDIRRV